MRSIAWGEWGSSRPSRVNASRFSYERIALGYCVGVCGRAGRGRAVGGYSTQLYAEHHPQLRGLNPRPRCYFDDQCRRQRWRGASLCLRHGIGGFPDPKRCVQRGEPRSVKRRHRYVRGRTHIQRRFVSDTGFVAQILCRAGSNVRRCFAELVGRLQRRLVQETRWRQPGHAAVWKGGGWRFRCRPSSLFYYA